MLGILEKGSSKIKEMLSLLASDGMLIKRPILICDDFVLVGFREKEWSELDENC